MPVPQSLMNILKQSSFRFIKQKPSFHLSYYITFITYSFLFTPHYHSEVRTIHTWSILYSDYFHFIFQTNLTVLQLLQSPDLHSKASSICVMICHIGEVKKEKSSLGHDVEQICVILADATAAIPAFFDATVISAAQKAFTQDTALRYVQDNYFVMICLKISYCILSENTAVTHYTSFVSHH